MRFLDSIAEFAFFIPDGGGDPLPLTTVWKFPRVQVAAGDTVGSNDLTITNPYDEGGELFVRNPVSGPGVGDWTFGGSSWPARIEAGASHTRFYTFTLDTSAFPTPPVGGGDRTSVVSVTAGSPAESPNG